jgi:four helix bundle protein
MFSLKNFRSYQMSLSLYRECEKLEARSHLKDQLLRASLSVPLNLSEGSAKESVKERRRFYGISLASLRETQTLLEILQAPVAVRELADRAGACIYRLVQASSRP